jgi:3'-phosphoadenosine 5'-phosphosulfate sulfotransferase (PAPS reductase)/FAD synthetase
VKALQFSGGLDSLATLFVKREEWDDILVLWCNTGAAYPDVVDYMNEIAMLVPHFEVVLSDKPAWEFINGAGVDVVPVDRTILGQSITSNMESSRYIDYLQCCSANIWFPLADAVHRHGLKHVIRGQRDAERRKAPIRSGHVDGNGILYEFPIQDWTKVQVLDYCKEVCFEWIPSYYANGELTSHDCWDCIAYLDENKHRIENLTGHMKVAVQNKLRDYRASVTEALTAMEALDGVFTGRP